MPSTALWGRLGPVPGRSRAPKNASKSRILLDDGHMSPSPKAVARSDFHCGNTYHSDTKPRTVSSMATVMLKGH